MPGDGAAMVLWHSFASNDEDKQNIQPRNVWLPKKIQLFEGMKAVEISANEDHTLAILENGELFSFGAGGLGQLGQPLPSEREHTQPVKVDHCRVKYVIEDQDSDGSDYFGKSFVRTYAGLGHNLGILKGGTVAHHGDAMFCGQCGLGLYPGIVHKPRSIPLPSCSTAIIAAGRVHSLFYIDDHNRRGFSSGLWNSGSATNGSLGIIPTRILFLSLRKLSSQCEDE